MAENDSAGKPADDIDLDEVARIVGALERDLAKVRSGSRDMQLLRDEVETLKNVLNSPIRRHHWVREGLRCYSRKLTFANDRLYGWRGEHYRAKGLSTTAALVILARRIARTAWSMYTYKTQFDPARLTKSLT
jgi:hypothetical protein